MKKPPRKFAPQTIFDALTSQNPITTFFAVPRAQILRREFLARAAGNHVLDNKQ